MLNRFLAKYLLFLAAKPNILKTSLLKNLLSILIVASLSTGCAVFRPSVAKPPAEAPQKRSVTFVDNIAINSSAPHDKTGNSYKAPSRLSPASSRPDLFGAPAMIERYSPLQFKYAILTNTGVEEMDNQKLLEFIDEWYGRPYRYGGTTKDGVDCSAFASFLLSSVYGVINLPRMAKDMYTASRRIKQGDLKEGDLVFFHTRGKHHTVTHVGIYLRNSKFVHASISGVMISDLGTGYYHDHYVGAGRVTDSGF
jgi:cell wall-associated NlpC family hydrolase